MNTLNNQDISYMQQALQLAQKAWDQGEVPVGALIVKDQQVIAEGWNQVITLNDPSAHAEVMAIRAAGQALQNYRQLDTTLYVTLEPCCMCAGALIHARIGRVVFGAYDAKTGAAGSRFSLLQDERHYHQLEVQGGVLEQACAAQIQAFFKQRRAEKKALKKQKQAEA